jgi:hypothetical protein
MSSVSVTITQALFIIGGGLALALGGLVLVRRRMPAEKLKPQHEVAGYIVAVVGVMYAVLVASVVVMAWTQFDATRRDVEHEAGAVANLIRVAEGLPAAERLRLELAIAAYVKNVLEDEWPAMADNRLSLPTQRALDTLWGTVRDAQLTSAHDLLLQDKLLDLVESVTELRRSRLTAASDGLSWLLWLVLIAGAAITIAYCYFFGVAQPKAQFILVGLLALMICLDLFLIAAVDLPFTGVLVVKADAFALLHQVLQQ